MRCAASASLGVTAAALALWAAAATGAPVVHGHGCVPADAHLLARSSYVRVFEMPRRRAVERRTIEACAIDRSGHITLLAPKPGDYLLRSLGDFHLAGRIVAFLETQAGVDSGTTRLVVVDVGARRVLRSLEAGSWGDAGLIDRQAVTRLVLTARGSIAWIAERTERRQLTNVSVYAAPRAGPPELLDSGTDIAPDSLALSGTTLRWSHAGAARIARMP